MPPLPSTDLAPSVLVVGAGPAGSAAAAVLAAAGVDVLLVDRSTFPRAKVCGDGITPGALRALDELGFDRSRLGSGNPDISRLALVSPGGRRWEPGLGEALVVERGLFDAAVLDHAVASGARFEAGWAVGGVEQVDGTLTVKARRGGESVDVRPRYLLAADGEFSTIRRALTGEQRKPEWLALRGYVDGVKEPPTQFEFHMTNDLRPGYGWAFPSGPESEGRANVGVYVPRAKGAGVALRGLYDAFVDGLGCTRGAPPQGSPITPWSPTRRARYGRALLLGDALGCADALSGEGIGPALRSGICAATAVVAALSAGDDALDRYASGLRAAFGPAHRRSSMLLGALEHAPWLVDRAFAAAAADPTLDAAVGAVVQANAHPALFLRPDLVARFWVAGWG